MPRSLLPLLALLVLLIPASARPEIPETALWQRGLSLIPYPQEVALGGPDFVLGRAVELVTDPGASPEERFAAQELSRELTARWQVETTPGGARIILSLNGAPARVGDQGYTLETGGQELTIRARRAQGLFYGVQSLLQLVEPGREGPRVAGMTIADWPDLQWRAVHYDTKHFQERREYVENFIRELARYKVNLLVWEWEDKFAYRSRPEIGAPGAFTPEEVRELTAFARRYHIQLVPLVQGLGHVSYILKHPRYNHLREIPSSNWQICPLKEESYRVLADLWSEAAAATPGSRFLHIGTDETWELGSCPDCQAFVEEHGRHALMQRFIARAHGIVRGLDRQPMSWGGVWEPGEKIQPPRDLITFGWRGDLDRRTVEAGYPLFYYDPNPGIEHLFLPYLYQQDAAGQEVALACLEQSRQAVSAAARTGIYQGVIATSWNCSGVHNQGWMLRYLVSAEYGWSGDAPGLAEFRAKFFRNYYGPRATDMEELFGLLSRGSYFYMDSFERKTWHWGEVGKTNLPDLPRDDLEYDPFWNTRYADRLDAARGMLPLMERAALICRVNRERGAEHSYDLELYEGLAELFAHTARTYLALSALERAIGAAHEAHFASHEQALRALEQAEGLIGRNLEERAELFGRIKATWEKSQLPKGLSTPDKQYVHGRDRQRNFANRRPDLSFMIYDEQQLGLERYREELRQYMQWYRETYLAGR